MTTPGPVSKKRRNRLTIVCRRCRRKKAKCDKAQPCGQCVKFQCPEDCIYDMTNLDSGSVKSDDMSLQIKRLIEKHFNSSQKTGPLVLDDLPDKGLFKFKKSVATPLLGYNPVLKSTDLLNMHMNFADQSASSQNLSPVGNFEYIEPRFSRHFRNFKTSQRPIFFVELLQLDPGARLYWRLNDARENIKLMTVQNFPMKKRSDVVKAAGAYFGRTFITSNQSSSSVAKGQLSAYGLPLGFTFTPSYNDFDHFQVNLRKVIPPEKCMIAYIKHFFILIYPSYPVVDEFWILDEVKRMFNFSREGIFHSVNISSKQDLLLVSMVLYILRLSYLSYFTSVRSQNEKILDSVYIGDIKLRDCPISLNTVNLGSNLYQMGSIRCKPSFLLLQAGILKCVARMLSFDNEIPFNHLDGEYNLGSLTSLAFALCLERDPDLIRNFPSGFKDKNLRRKVWYTLVHVDYMLSYVSHKPRIIYQTQFNTRLPEFDGTGSNIENIALEELVIKSIAKNFEVLSAGDKILDMCLDMKLSFKALDVVQTLNDFELILADKFGFMSDYFKPRTCPLWRAVIISQLAAHTSIQLFIAYAYYFFYLYYKHRGESSLNFFFLKKTLSILYSDFDYFCVELMFTEEQSFSYSFTLLLSPLLLVLVHVIGMVGFALAATLNCSILVSDIGDSDSSRIQLLRVVAHKNETFSLRKQKFFKLMSERYFYAWKCTKMDGPAYSLLYDELFYMVDIKLLRNASVSWTDDQIQKFCALIPDEPPIIAEDPELVRDLSYQSTRSIDDTDFVGKDLYKTVQSDNFWIVINTLVEREPNAFHASQSAQILQQRMEPNVNNITTKRNDDFTRPEAPQDFSLLRPSPSGQGLEANVSEILDFNLFNTDWTVEDIL